MNELTPWFPGTVKPARTGIYEREMEHSGRVYARWDGFRWFIACHSIGEAVYECCPSGTPWRWRGLAKEPK